MVYDITNPFDVQFVNYANNRTFAHSFAFATSGDLGPEGLVFIKPEDSPTGAPPFVIVNEISGTTTIYTITHE